MGCDIHSVCEVYEDGKWRDAGDVFPVPEYLVRFYGKRKYGMPFNARNYLVFSILAGVRGNGSVKPISLPRGLPEDWVARDDWHRDWNKSVMSPWNEDAHSHSWLLASELLNYDYGEVEHRLSSEFTTTLQVLRELGDPDKVRVVFWFDS